MINPISAIHERMILNRRFQTLAQQLAPLLPTGASVLDVGCGDGKMAAELMRKRADCRIKGLDVLVRPETAIPVQAFDGVKIPEADGSVDAVLFVDVLHHTDDPIVLLREAARVARKCVIIKDHVREGFAAGPILRAMDWVGNSRFGVRLPYLYWNTHEWNRGFAAAGLRRERWTRAVKLYPAPITWLCDRGLHVIAVLTPALSEITPARLHQDGPDVRQCAR